MKLRHVLGVAAATMTVASGVIVALPQIALAHTPSVNDTCSQLEVDLVSYESKSGDLFNNKVTVTIDGVAQEFWFDAEFHKDFPWSQTVDHTWSVVIDANIYTSSNKTTYDKTFSGTQKACKPPQATQVSWTPTDGTCVNPTGTLAVNYDATKADYSGSPAGNYAPGSSASGTFTAKTGYTLTHVGMQPPLSHTFSVAGAPCQLANNPVAALNAVCAAWSATFTNVVDGIDPWETVADAEFDLVVDGITEHIVVPANTTQTRNGSFAEDSGDHTVTVGQQTLTVKTDCEPNEILPPVLTASYDCYSQTSSYTLDPSENENWTAGEVLLEGNTYSVVITPKDGFTFGEAASEDGTITLTATFAVTTDCVIPPPALTATYDCVSQKSTPTLTPPSSQQWTAGPISQSGNTYSVTITPNEGLRFANPGENGTVTLTATFTVTTGCEQTVASPQVTPPTCSAPGSVTLPASERYTWRTNDDGTYTAVANPGVRLVGTTTFGPFELAQLTGEECVIPTIDLAAFSPVCQADTPYIQYEIKVTGTTADDATLTFFDLDGNQVAKYVDVPLSGRVIYPGASVNPPDWPGWKLNSAGLWEIDPTDARLRDGLTVTVEVNPTATANVTYPPATETCSDPDQVESQAPTTTVQLVQLPSTGSGSGRIAGVGGLLLLAGGAMVFLVRRPRHA